LMMGIPEPTIASYFLWRNQLDAQNNGREDPHIAHRDHIMDLLNPEPMQNVRHQRLEPHILHPSNHLRALEVLIGRIASPLPEIVDEVLGDLTQCTTFLAEVNDEANSAALSAADALLDGIDEVGLAGADVGTEDVGAVTFVVDADGEFFGGVLEVLRGTDCRTRLDELREVEDVGGGTYRCMQ
jgi:hypothetical protein